MGASRAQESQLLSWVRIPGGRFLMGSFDFYAEEAPQHERSVEPFEMAATPTTNDEFAAFVADTGYVTVAERPLSESDFPHLGAARRAPGSLVFAPTDGIMYPPGFSTRVSVQGVADTLDGLSRPGHFTGVATVVLKLLNLVRPDKVFLGEKDWQQVAVLRRMITDLNVTVEVVGVPTVRSEDGASRGLALSSRNSYLNDEQKARATVLSRALRAVQDAYAGGERSTAALRQAGLTVLNAEPEVNLDYLTIVDSNLQEHATVTDDPFNRILIAARLFGVRLIDNMPLSAGGPA